MKPVAIISTDFHLKLENIEEVIQAHQQIIEAANTLHHQESCNLIHIWAGDIFDSRVSQREDVLLALKSILDMYFEEGIKIHCIPGNHDKTNYNSTASFLEAFSEHPSLHLYSSYGNMQHGNFRFHFIPFFNDQLWDKELHKALKYMLGEGQKEILITHTAISGSRNNDGTIVDCPKPPKLFKGFDKVILGHYHNYQEVAHNIIHIGSLLQNNFGEDEDKGAWVLYDNCDVDILPIEMKKYRKLEIDLTSASYNEADAMIIEFTKKNEGHNVRVEVWGESSVVDAFDKSKYKEQGIDIKLKRAETESGIVFSKNIDVLKGSDIAEKFKSFCEENSYDYEEGIKILEQVL